MWGVRFCVHGLELRVKSLGFRDSGLGYRIAGLGRRGQPLSFTLSFGEISWFDEKGETRRCDWLKRNP
jgi:hypothetical protein